MSDEACDEACPAGMPSPLSLHRRRNIAAAQSHKITPLATAPEDALIDALAREINSFGGYVKVNLLMMSKHLKRLLGRERKLLPVLRSNPRIFSLSHSADGDLFVYLMQEHSAQVDAAPALPETVSCRARALEEELRGLLLSIGPLPARELLRAGHVRKRLSPLVAFCPAKFGLGSGSSILCKFFASGRCARGNACTFSHGGTTLQDRGNAESLCRRREGCALAELDGLIGWLDDLVADTRAEGYRAFGRHDRVASAVACARCSPLVDALMAFVSARPKLFSVEPERSSCIRCAASVACAPCSAPAGAETAETELRERVTRFLMQRPHDSWLHISVRFVSKRTPVSRLPWRQKRATPRRARRDARLAGARQASASWSAAWWRKAARVAAVRRPPSTATPARLPFGALGHARARSHLAASCRSSPVAIVSR